MVLKEFCVVADGGDPVELPPPRRERAPLVDGPVEPVAGVGRRRPGARRTPTTPPRSPGAAAVGLRPDRGHPRRLRPRRPVLGRSLEHAALSSGKHDGKSQQMKAADGEHT